MKRVTWIGDATARTEFQMYDFESKLVTFKKGKPVEVSDEWSRDLLRRSDFEESKPEDPKTK